MTPTGDHRFLEGQMHGDELQLSTFAGGLAYLYKLKVGADGALEGDYWQGTRVAREGRRTSQRLQRRSTAPARQTTLRDNAQAFAFTFPDVDGKPVSLSDERFRGKVVLVTLGGTWCPNCHDEAQFLLPFLSRAPRPGLRSHRADVRSATAISQQAAQAVRHYREDLRIDFPTLIAGLSET
jgi:thiol-disulfide isomerase/thioredoxin